MTRRLLIHLAASEQMIEPPDLSNNAQGLAWVGLAKYLDGRIHSTPEEKPGRKPDMSPEAAAAMRAVLADLAKAYQTNMFKKMAIS